MESHLERRYIISGRPYYEDDLKKVREGTSTFYILDHKPHTRAELETLSTSWRYICNINGKRYTRQTLEDWLEIMLEKPARAYRISGVTATVSGMEMALGLFNYYDYKQKQKKISGTMDNWIGKGMGKEITGGELGGYELQNKGLMRDVARKVQAALKQKVRTTIKHENVKNELRRTKRMVMSKEEELKECEKAWSLDAKQTKTGSRKN